MTGAPPTNSAAPYPTEPTPPYPAPRPYPSTQHTATPTPAGQPRPPHPEPADSLPLTPAPPPDGAPRLPRRRGIELALVLFAIGIAGYGYCAVSLGTDGSLPHGATRYGAGLAALALLAHLAVRLAAPYADPLLLPIAVLLNGLGLVLDLPPRPGHPRGPRRARATGVVGPGRRAVHRRRAATLRDHRTLQRYAYVSVADRAGAMLVPVFFPAVNGARIWIRLAGFSIQPGEFAKVLLAVFFAAYLAANRRRARVHRTQALAAAASRPGGCSARSSRSGSRASGCSSWSGTSARRWSSSASSSSCCTWRPAAAAGSRSGCCSRALGAWAVGALEPHVHSRVEDWLHPFASDRRGARPGPARAVAVRVRLGRTAGHRTRAGALGAHRLRREVRLHPGHRRRGAGPGRTVPRSCCCTGCWWPAATGPGWRCGTRSGSCWRWGWRRSWRSRCS